MLTGVQHPPVRTGSTHCFSPSTEGLQAGNFGEDILPLRMHRGTESISLQVPFVEGAGSCWGGLSWCLCGAGWKSHCAPTLPAPSTSHMWDTHTACTDKVHMDEVHTERAHTTMVHLDRERPGLGTARGLLISFGGAAAESSTLMCVTSSRVSSWQGAAGGVGAEEDRAAPTAPQCLTEIHQDKPQGAAQVRDVPPLSPHALQTRPFWRGLRVCFGFSGGVFFNF